MIEPNVRVLLVANSYLSVIVRDNLSFEDAQKVDKSFIQLHGQSIGIPSERESYEQWLEQEHGRLARMRATRKRSSKDLLEMKLRK